MTPLSQMDKDVLVESVTLIHRIVQEALASLKNGNTNDAAEQIADVEGKLGVFAPTLKEFLRKA
jgi:hypothetical protein